MNIWTSIRDRYRVTVNPLLTERRVELAIIALVLLLVLQFVYGGARLALLSTPEAVLPAADSLQVTDSYSRQTITAEQGNEIRNRPLFWSSRRPVDAVVKAPAPKKEKTQEFKGFKLIGLFGVGESVGIIVRAEDKIVRLRTGEKLNGWTLDSVGIREAVFASGERKEILTLKAENVTGGVGENKSERGR